MKVPQHEVLITYGFWLGETSVTQEQWAAVIEAASNEQNFPPEKLDPNPSRFQGFANLPVERVRLEDCEAFCRLLDRIVAHSPGFCMPTEAQWEYACRAGTQSAFSDGSACTLAEGLDPALDKLGWFCENSQSTHPVKEKAPNNWGIYDMHGNVWERCSDAWYPEQYKFRTGEMVDPFTDGAANDVHVVRGGSWARQAGQCRAASRSHDLPRGGLVFTSVGLRLCAGRTSPDKPQSVLTTIPMFAPRWAEVFGEDDYGIFAEFSLKKIRFVWRWIPPGRFLMGSPLGEAGRYRDEGPEHTVTISRGFWLGETPVTQEQWSSVMESNPSRFLGKQRPVEHITWHQSRNFAESLNKRRPGLNASLPTEAQWEYACRAGTRGAFHVEASHCSEPTGNDPVLDQLGWFDHNSVYETYDVKHKLPNAWGLYDTHGNVWEWCLDGKRKYRKQPQIDPIGPMDEGNSSVVRGGSWFDQARLCRAAVRGQFVSGVDCGDYGMRLCLFTAQ